MACSTSKTIPPFGSLSSAGAGSLGCSGSHCLRGGTGGFGGSDGGVGAGFGGALGRGGSGEKKSALSTSTSSGSLRLMPRWMCRGPSSLFWGWICSFSSNIGVHSFGCVCRHVVGMMLSTARAGRQVAVWSSSLSQPKDSQMWSGQGESTKRAAPFWIRMWTVR